MATRLLTVQTATPAGSIALTEGETLLGEFCLNVRRTHNDWLMEAIDSLLDNAGLQASDLDGFAVVVGPGAFTGLRVGMATVKGLALGTGRPIVGVSSLQTLALQAPYARMPVCALLDARKQEVYAGMFSWETGWPEALSDEQVVRPEALLTGLKGDILFIGDGAQTYRSLIVRQLGAQAHFVPAVSSLPRAASAALLALREWENGHQKSPEELAPCYIRPSEAELNWRG